MALFRFKALEMAISREVKPFEIPNKKISEYFGELTFNDAAMREYLTKDAYRQVKSAIETGTQLDRAVADQIAASMKAWSSSKGATHYTHWFQPLTGATAEKHDAFINPEDGGKAIENFHGQELIQQEPDASSFPNGGIRNTFEARGYTAWDPSSPAFVLDNTLCIPTVFVSYTGEALDYKTPLLKALNEVDKAAVSVCQYFDRNITKVHATLGWEQEYFLIDSALYNARPDLVLTNRTLFGHASAKDQQLSDHYFGTIPERVVSFMKEFEYEAHRLGIPVKTRHNEVAPNQFECAPVYEEANLAVDHNQLLMHLIKKVASHHNLTVLLHEKPFASVNGSGKHNNWSLASNTGVNLLSPGRTKRENMRFLSILAAILKAVHLNADLLRASIASAGNDHRLGANEAPPAIISAFIGQHLSRVLDRIEKTGEVDDRTEVEEKINIMKIPQILLDNTDRNRTSPFAFTGNKFELRAAGSAQNCAQPMIVLNLIVAEQLNNFRADVDALIATGMNKDDALLSVIRNYTSSARDIRFEGNSYSDEWKQEAEKRGLNNINSTPQALKAFVSEKTVRLFEYFEVLSERELEARYTIKLENYLKLIQIEARTMGDLATNHIIPVAIQYQNRLLANAQGLKEVLDTASFNSLAQNQLKSIKEISIHISSIKEMVEAMVEARKTANALADFEQKANAYADTVKPWFEKIRYEVDKLEMLVDDELWPLPKYRELLFSR